MGGTIYRGFSSVSEYERAQRTGFVPLEPLDANADFFAVLEQDAPVDHVMERKRQHFVSFSLTPRAACCYATSRLKGGKVIHYCNAGWIAEVVLPSFTGVSRAYVGGECSQYDGGDESIWIDPRFHLAGDNWLSWQTMRDRARVDDEILLARGVARVTRIMRVEPSQCDRSFVPWAQSGEKIEIR